MDRERFEKLVARAVESMPEEFTSRLDNVDVVVADQPTAVQLKRSRLGRSYTLLGLYEGIPLTSRTPDYGMVPPDKITIFQRSIESVCSNDNEIVTEIQKVVKHEIAHHFGIGDARLEQIERGQD